MSETVIRTAKLGRDFKTVTALDGLDLEVPAGIVFGFLGPNGSGKTTTIRLLLGLLEPTAAGPRCSATTCAAHGQAIRARSGALLEHTGLYERLSAADNLEFYGRIWRLREAERRARIRELLTHFGLWDRRAEQAGALEPGHEAEAGRGPGPAAPAPPRLPRRAHGRARPGRRRLAARRPRRPGRPRGRRPSSSRPTTSTRPSGCAAGWPSSAPGASSPWARSRSSSAAPPRPRRTSGAAGSRPPSSDASAPSPASTAWTPPTARLTVFWNGSRRHVGPPSRPRRRRRRGR